MKNLSKTKIKKHLRNKTSSELISTIMEAKKHKPWLVLAKMLSSSTRKYPSVNLDELEKITTAGDTILVPGKVLGIGNISKKIRICALGFSASALEKLKTSKSEAVSILEEIKKNTKAEGIRIIK